MMHSNHHEELAMDMLATQHAEIPLGAHTYTPKQVLHAIGIEGKRPSSVEARRLKDGVGIFCVHGTVSKKGNLVYRLHISGAEDLKVYPGYEVPHQGKLVLFAYIAVCGKFVIEALDLGVLAEAKPGREQEIRVHGGGVRH